MGSVHRRFHMHNLKPKKLRTLILATLTVAALSACAPLDVVDGGGFSGFLSGARNVEINGIKLAQSDNFRMGGLEQLPRVRTTSDLRSLEQNIKLMTQARDQAFAQEEVALGVILGHVAAQMAALQATVVSSSREAVADLRDSRGSAVRLKPGAYAILPALHTEARATMAALPAMTETLAQTSPFFSFEHAVRVEVAQAGSGGALLEALRAINRALETTNNALGTVTGQGAPIQSATASGAVSASLYTDMPANTPFALPNGAIAERVVEANATYFVLHNPTDSIVIVPPNQLGYFPKPPEFSQLRKQAAPIMVRIAENIREDREMRRQVSDYQWSNFSGVNQAFGGYTTVGYSTYTPGFLGPDGSLTRDLQVRDRARELSRNDRNPFGRAVKLTRNAFDEASRWGCHESYAEFREFVERDGFDEWLKQGGMHGGPSIGVDARSRYADMIFRGPNAESLQVNCHRMLDRHLYQTSNYYVGEDRVVRDAAELYALSAVVRNIHIMDERFDAYEDMATIVPVAGNVISALRCIGQDAGRPVAYVASEGYRRISSYREYASPLMIEPQGETTTRERVENGLDCAAAIPALGQSITGARMALRIKEAFPDASAAGRMMDVLELFNTRLTRRDTEIVGRIAALPNTASSVRQGQVIKDLYDLAQNTNSMLDFREGLITVLGQ
ncbi:hypothetical protein [Azoarcus taiwanensis]